jgi:serine/threonine-protein phosphatase 2A regulatory subunit A
LCSLLGDKTWRVRLATVFFLPKLAKVIGREMFQAKLESVLINMLMDNVFTIREAAVESLIKISKVTM